MTMNWTFQFSYGDRVMVDGCPSVIGRIICQQVIVGSVERYLVSWWNEGTLKEEWIDGVRLSPA